MRIRTGYGFHVTVGHINEVVSRLKEIKWKVAPISDRDSTFGFVRYTKLAKEAGLRPIYGVELGVVENLGEKKPSPDFWTFFAKDSLLPLHELIDLAGSQGVKEPCLNYDQATSAKGLIKITGERLLIDLVKPTAKDLYFGLSPSVPKGLLNSAKKKGMKFIATSANKFTREADLEFYKIALGWRADNQSYPQHILSDKEWNEALWFAEASDKKKALANRALAIAQCKAVLGKATLLIPPKPKSLRQLCEEGAKKLKIDLRNNTYKSRLERELAMIKEKDFEDYFFIIADMMQFARTKMIVGPARGSSCGSLACYLLGITAIDPIKYDLVFERFIDVTRRDLPDIDLDFSDVKRDEVFEYMARKYGREKSARLGSVNMFKAKAALNQVGLTLKIPSWLINEVSNTVIKRSMGDSRVSSTVADTLKDTEVGKKLLDQYPEASIASRLEWHPSNAGQHAAGLVMTNDPVVNFVAVDGKSGTAMCDKKDAEELNLLKIDMLGLTQLSIFERTLELIGKKPRSDFLEALPLDDQAAFDQLNNGRFAGVFQFAPGSASSHLVDSMVNQHGGRMDNIEDIISMTAIVRPGPLASGSADSWIRRRTGHEDIVYEHPKLKPFLEKTMGIVIYQEQVMQIGREIGGLSWDDVTALRKAMSRSLGKEYFDQFGDRWKSGAKKTLGMSQLDLDKMWDKLCEYGAWAFNRSHSVAYGMVSYWCCWLKAHHPVEYAAASLDAESEPARQIVSLREMAAEGIKYKAIDLDHSTDKWQPIEQEDGSTILVGPLTNAFGIGPAKVTEILDARSKNQRLKPGLIKALSNIRTPIDTLTPVSDAIQRLAPDLNEVGIVTKPTPVVDVNPGIRGQVVIIALAKRIMPLNENEPSRVAKRGGEVWDGPTDALNMFFSDDTGEIFCKVGRFDYAELGPKVLEKAKAGQSIFAIKGTVPSGFRMISVKQIKYLGRMDGS